MKTESTVKFVLRLALTLLAITAAVAVCLAGVNAITAPAIDALNAQKTQDAIEMVLPGGGEEVAFPETNLVSKVLNTAAADQNNGVLLQVVANTGDVSGNFHTIGQTHTSDLTQCRVRLLGGSGTNGSANATLLGGRQAGSLVLQGVQTSLQSRCGGLVGGLLTAAADQLIKSRHLISPFFDSRRLAGIYSTEDFRKNRIN
jgi:hypothetical protein